MRNLLLAISALLLSVSTFAQSVTTDSSNTLTPTSATLYGTYHPSTPAYLLGKFYYGTDRNNLNQTIDPNPYYSNTELSVSVTPSNLSSSTTYYYCFKGADYTLPPSPYSHSGDTLSFETPPNIKDAPTEPTENIQFSNVSTTSLSANWTKGNGDYRIVLANTANNFTDLADNTSYTANSNYASADPLNNGDRVVYKGTGSFVNIIGLTTNTTYYFKVVEFNNDSPNERYANDVSGASGNPANQTTIKDDPTSQASNILFSNVSKSSIRATWTNGNGENRVCLINTSNSFTNLTDGLTYSIGSTLTNGDRVIANGASNTVNASGLNEGQVYWFKVIEYNNTSTNTRYNNSDNNGNPEDKTTSGTITWLGVNTDWTSGSNWSSGAEPIASADARIPNTSNDPVISNSGNQVNNITIEAGAAITVNNGGALSVFGDATFESPNNSGAAGQLVITGSGNFSVSGTTTYERYNLNDGAFILAPTENASAYTTYPAYYMDIFDESALDNESNGWVPQVGSDDANNDVQTGLNGWFINKSPSSNSMINFVGTLKNGNKSFTFSNSGSDADNGWAIVGNPYPCAIDVENSGFNVGSGLSDIVYVYNHGGGSPYYSSYNIGTSSGDARYIAATQGFWMEATSNGAQLTISNSARTNNSANFRKSATVAYPSIDLSVANNDFTRKAKLSFIEGFSDALDNGKETKYLDDPWSKGMGIFLMSSDNKKLAENVFSLATLNSMNDGDTLFVDMGILGYNGDSIEINSFAIKNMPSGIKVLLYNKLTDESKSLSDASTKIKLEFEANEINSYNRGLNEDYQIALAKSGTILSTDNKKPEDTEANIKYIVKENTVIIKSDIFLNNSGVITVYDIMGKVVNSKDLENSKKQSITIPANGAYIIKIKTKSNTYTKKVVNI